MRRAWHGCRIGVHNAGWSARSHGPDHHNLWLTYADRSAPAQPILGDGDECETEYWTIGDCELSVIPIDGGEYYFWVIQDVEGPIFVSPLDKVVVYLLLPFGNEDRRNVQLTLQDEIYWISDGQVIAAGMIDQVLQELAIVTSEGLIVPLIVEPFLHRFKPFSLDKAIDEDNLEAYRKFLDSSAVENVTSEQVQTDLWEGQVRAPSLATELDRDLGIALLSYIDDDYRRIGESTKNEDRYCR